MGDHVFRGEYCFNVRLGLGCSLTREKIGAHARVRKHHNESKRSLDFNLVERFRRHGFALQDAATKLCRLQGLNYPGLGLKLHTHICAECARVLRVVWVECSRLFIDKFQEEIAAPFEILNRGNASLLEKSIHNIWRITRGKSSP